MELSPSHILLACDELNLHSVSCLLLYRSYGGRRRFLRTLPALRVSSPCGAHGPGPASQSASRRMSASNHLAPRRGIAPVGCTKAMQAISRRECLPPCHNRILSAPQRLRRGSRSPIRQPARRPPPPAPSVCPRNRPGIGNPLAGVCEASRIPGRRGRGHHLSVGRSASGVAAGVGRQEYGDSSARSGFSSSSTTSSTGFNSARRFLNCPTSRVASRRLR